MVTVFRSTQELLLKRRCDCCCEDSSDNVWDERHEASQASQPKSVGCSWMIVSGRIVKPAYCVEEKYKLLQQFCDALDEANMPKLCNGFLLVASWTPPSRTQCSVFPCTASTTVLVACCARLAVGGDLGTHSFNGQPFQKVLLDTLLLDARMHCLVHICKVHNGARLQLLVALRLQLIPSTTV